MIRVFRRPLAAALSCAFAALCGAQSPSPRQELTFEPTPRPAEFLARSAGVEWGVRAGGLVARTAAGEARLTLTGAPGVALQPLDRAPGVSHYYIGNDPAAWRTNVPHYRSLLAHDLRPGVDMRYHAAGGDLEFDLLLQPGADPTALRLTVTAPEPPHACADGSVAVRLGDGELHLQPPTVYQRIAGTRAIVPCRYVVDGRDLRFELGRHDPDLALTIDPVVTFATLLGGSAGADEVKGVHIDSKSNLLVTGKTQASDFPLLNPLPFGYRFDIGFVTKFDPSGALVFSTFFGGTSGLVAPVDVGSDPDGQVVVGGNTTSPNLPTTGGVVQPALKDGGDWFFVDLLADGSLSWCTYYGGPGNQQGMRALKVLDIKRGSVLAVGVEGSFPYEPNAYSQTGGLVCAGIFGGNVLWASTACGFSGTPNAVDVTSQGHIVITGTVSGSGSGLPTTGASLQPNPAPGGGIDGFVFVFTGQANSLVWATYFGGTGNDSPRAVHAEPGPGTFRVTLAGDTSSTDLPMVNAIRPQRGNGQDGFVAQIDGLTQSLSFSSYLGGADGGESVSGVGVDANGNVVVAGQSSSADLPFTNALKLPNPASNRDVMLWRLTPTGTLDWCTMWGGGGSEVLVDLDVTPGGEIAVAGTVAGANFPGTVNALPATLVSQDVFVARLDPRSQVSYGQGTAGYGGFVPVLAGGGSSAIGTTTLLQIHDGRARAVGVLFAGVGRISLPVFNGFLLVNPLLQQTIVLNGSTATTPSTWGGGYLHLGIPIPNNPSAHGATFDWQAAFLDAAANGGVSLTNGVELTIQ